MNSRARRSVCAAGLVGMAILLVSSLSGCGKSTPAGSSQPAAGGPSQSVSGRLPTNGTLKQNNEAAVTVAVRWAGEKEGMLNFEIAMDTHSVALDGYDLAKLAVLVDDGGKTYSPASWSTSTSGGHHTSGTLSFQVPQLLASGQTKHLKLIIKGIAGVAQRVFDWDL